MKFKETGLYRWLDNFWYHYKWITVIVSIFVIFALVSAVQLFSREETDIYVMYAGPQVINVQNMTYIERAFENIAGDDYTGDGKIVSTVRDVTIMSEEEIKEASGSDTGTVPNEGYKINENIVRTQTSDALKTFNQEIFGGDSVICLLSPYTYSIVRAADGFLPLEDVLGYMPENAYDECAVYLSNTDFGSLEGLTVLPDDTLLCVRRVSSMSFLKGKEKTENAHEYHLEVFRNIMNFKKDVESLEQ